jgi:DNA-binding beta-propeller fold protein YncE
VADTDHDVIRKIQLFTGFVFTLAGKVDEGGSSDGLGFAARFNRPQGIVSDGKDLFIADTDNCLIRKITLSSSEVSTIAGKSLTSGKLDAIGADARFYWPSSLAYADGNLYVADTGNNIIRAIDLESLSVSTLAGKANSIGELDGIGHDARFNIPTDIAVSGTTLYILDAGSGAIRTIDLQSSKVETLISRDSGLSGMAKICAQGDILFIAEGDALYEYSAENAAGELILNGEWGNVGGMNFASEGNSLFICEESGSIWQVK